MPIHVYDFFSGCGGTSAGLRESGMVIVVAIDNNHDAAETYRHNFPEATFLEQDIREIQTEDLEQFINTDRIDPILFCCCSPCQSFSVLNRNRNHTDERARLLEEFIRFVEYYLPEYILLENVPGADIDSENSPFSNFCRFLETCGYHFEYQVVEAQNYGVPQRRRRLVLLASLIGPITIPAYTHGEGTLNPNYVTVRQALEGLPPIAAGETHQIIPNHQAPRLTEINMQRIMAIPPGGDRRDLPEALVLKCHRDFNGHFDVYGRMRWNEPATGLTARCTSLSNGRFGHPDQHRAISGREAARLQTFSDDFVFLGPLTSFTRQIGNAVPVLLAQRCGEHIIEHLLTHQV